MRTRINTAFGHRFFNFPFCSELHRRSSILHSQKLEVRTRQHNESRHSQALPEGKGIDARVMPYEQGDHRAMGNDDDVFIRVCGNDLFHGAGEALAGLMRGFAAKDQFLRSGEELGHGFKKSRLGEERYVTAIMFVQLWSNGHVQPQAAGDDPSRLPGLGLGAGDKGEG